MTANLISKPYNQNGIYNPKYLNERQVTNCLLEVPQRLNLQLADGTLTLKAGSVAIFPNGFEADGKTRKFDYVSVPTDKTSKPAYTRTNGIVYTDRKFSVFGDYPYAYSGDTAPTGQMYMLWYDTKNNFVKKSKDSGATWTSNHSFPLGLVNCGANGYTAINQVFNGMGYIGSTVWVDKGVKGLAPNLRNADGTLNNLAIEVPTLALWTDTNSSNIVNTYFLLTQTGKITRQSPYTYVAEDNINLQSNGTPSIMCPFVNCSVSQGQITRFNPVLPFRAADAQNVEQIKTDLNQIEADLALKANVTDLDGSWTVKNLPIASQVVPTIVNQAVVLTYDLTDYLPKDGKRYEVLVEGYIWTGNNSGNSLSLEVREGNIGYYICGAITTGGSGQHGMAMGTVIAIIDADRKLQLAYYSNVANAGQIRTSKVIGYRKVR